MSYYKYIIINCEYDVNGIQNSYITNWKEYRTSDIILDKKDVDDIINDCRSKLNTIYHDPKNSYTFNNIRDALAYYKSHVGYGYLFKNGGFIFKISLEYDSVENLGDYYTVRRNLCSLHDKVESLENEIHALKSENEILKTMIHYQPDGDGAKECQQHFSSLCSHSLFTIRSANTMSDDSEN